jgi:hypothetical protein
MRGRISGKLVDAPHEFLSRVLEGTRGGGVTQALALFEEGEQRHTPWIAQKRASSIRALRRGFFISSAPITTRSRLGV